MGKETQLLEAAAAGNNAKVEVCVIQLFRPHAVVESVSVEPSKTTGYVKPMKSAVF